SPTVTKRKLDSPPLDPCDDGNPVKGDVDPLHGGDLEIQGVVYGIPSGRVSVCLNGKRLGTTTTFKDYEFDVTLPSDAPVKEGNFLRLVFEPDNGARAILDTKVGPSKTITVDACTKAKAGDQKIYLDTLRSGASELTAMLPDGGVVTVCVNGVQSD